MYVNLFLDGTEWIPSAVIQIYIVVTDFLMETATKSLT